ncbi:MAG: hypothetical protein KatS3mg008_0836 [Acidimicrobiales bacterium]|nr:MAG: hypothetical protein KatS3mg008_0836 [Acidimicrobiales bacterium]
MVLAEVEYFHSPRVAPTRRLALGTVNLPVHPAPGFGGVLVGGMVASAAKSIDPDLLGDLIRLMDEVEAGRRIAQPRLRHRFQRDRVGLRRVADRLVGDGGRLRFELPAESQSAEQRILAAVYAAGSLPRESRPPVFDAMRTGLRWRGAIDDRLVEALLGATPGHRPTEAAMRDPLRWALGVLGLRDQGSNGHVPDRATVMRSFRARLRAAHPDHGGDPSEAARRIADLREARRILLERP